ARPPRPFERERAGIVADHRDRLPRDPPRAAGGDDRAEVAAAVRGEQSEADHNGERGTGNGEL
ncbi:MAG: hypothetical protein AVDCRST_MAG18-303, partial [uncultured Thermomicrobiales bacterium]